MPTINSRELVDKLIAANGRFEGDPQIYKITQYDNAFGGICYGLDYSVEADGYQPSDYVRNPKIIWRFGEGEPKAAVDMAVCQVHLSEVLKKWCEREALPFQSADELALLPSLTSDQEYFLQCYTQVWDVVCK